MEQTDESIQVRNALVLENLGFVYSHVKEKWGGLKKSGHYQDAISEGFLGLIRAAEKFDPSMGNTFITYAVHWIDQKISMYVSQASIPVTMPPNRIALRKSIEKKYRKLGHQESLALSELFPDSDGPRAAIVLSAVLSKALPTNIFDSLTDGSGSPLDLLLADENRDQMIYAIQSLGKRNATIVLEYYGLSGEDKTLDAIGKILQVTRERIRQILNSTRGSLGRLLKVHFSENIPRFDSLIHIEHGVSWSEDRLNDSAHQYFDTPIYGWIKDCPCCGDSVWNARKESVACQNCGYDSDATRICDKCGGNILIGFPCYCDYLPHRVEATLGWNIRQVLLFHSPCSLERLIDELDHLGFTPGPSDLLVRLQRDGAIIKGMDGNYYLRETAPTAILDLARIEKRLDQIEIAFRSKSESLEYRLQNNRKNADLVTLIRKELLAVEHDYLTEKERLIAKWEILVAQIKLANQGYRENAGDKNG
jgi:RNA polymerase sigma factor (sigma-70 family)